MTSTLQLENYANLNSGLDRILSSKLEEDNTRVNFFKTKIEERKQLTTTITQHITNRILKLHSRQLQLRELAVYGMSSLVVEKAIDSISPQISALESKISDELTASFTLITELEEKLIEVQLELSKSRKTTELFEGTYGINRS